MRSDSKHWLETVLIANSVLYNQQTGDNVICQFVTGTAHRSHECTVTAAWRVASKECSHGPLETDTTLCDYEKTTSEKTTDTTSSSWPKSGWCNHISEAWDKQPAEGWKTLFDTHLMLTLWEPCFSVLNPVLLISCQTWQTVQNATVLVRKQRFSMRSKSMQKCSPDQKWE